MTATAQCATETTLQRDWLRLRPLIVKAAKWTGSYDEADLLRGVLANVFTFWPGENGFIFACIDRFPKLTRLHLLLAGGDHNEVAEIEKEVVNWAKSQGATQAYTEARLGLDRLNLHGKSGYYSDHGYTRSRVVYTKDI